jgi:UDP-N-acetylmuramoylalanine--D-glutamate ligase
LNRPELPRGPYLVVGLARSGQAAALALRERGEPVIGWDSGHPAGVESLAGVGVELHLGEGDGVPLLSQVASVIKSPGVPRGVSVIERALMAGLTVVGELELAWRMLANEFVAVTGTNGKTTTVELIGHIHRVAGLPVAVAGNVGAALSGFAGRLDPRATVACEVSSFQLEDAVEFAPEMAVLLNVAPDHLDRHGTLEAYTQAKLRIFAEQRAVDVAVLPLGLDVGPIPGAARRVRFGEGADVELAVVDGALYWQGERLLQAREIGIPGRHNLENAMAAAAACLTRGVDPAAVSEGLRTFPGVAHRLEAVAQLAGVRYINDSKATNVTSALVGVKASAGQTANIHLILGGLDKGQDFTPLAAAVAGACRAVYLIGRDADSIAQALTGIDVPVNECGTLERAVELAAGAASSGDVVLLSPACASLDQFVDYEARGDRFKELVAGLG